MTHIRVEIVSFGYLHNDMPTGDGLVIDLRRKLRDPHTNPAMRALTGLDPAVRDNVLTMPDSDRITAGIVQRTLALLHGHDDQHDLLTRIFIGCQGGRHRSVAIAEQAATWLRDVGIGVEVTHSHINRPVVCRNPGETR